MRKARGLSQVCIIHLINHGHVFCCFHQIFSRRQKRPVSSVLWENIFFSSTFFLKTFGSIYWPKCLMYALQNSNDTIFDYSSWVIPKIRKSVVTLKVHPTLKTFFLITGSTYSVKLILILRIWFINNTVTPVKTVTDFVFVSFLHRNR